MSVLLRGFLDEVREDFWAHDYEEDAANDILGAASRALERRPPAAMLDLLRGILDLDLVVELDSRDPDVRGVLDDHDSPKGMLDDLVCLLVRHMLWDEDRPANWESLPLDQQDGPTAREDKRRVSLRHADQHRPYGSPTSP
jgi:hypothetical protein